MFKERNKGFTQSSHPFSENKKRIAHISNNLDEINKEKLRYLAKKYKIDYNVYGNSATKYFLAREKNRNQRKIIKSMTINNSECNNPIEIGKHVYESYNQIFNQNDPYKHGDIEEFLGTDGLAKIGKIKNEISVICESLFSLAEVTAAVNNLGKMKNGGPDKVTSELIKFIFRLCPILILHVCNNIANGETGLASDFLKRYIIFIRKPNSTKTNIKMLRPISLISNIVKLISYMNSNRIINALNDSNIVPAFWNAYLKGKDPNSCLRTIFDNFENSTKFNIKTVTIVNDIDSAFDGCSRKLILEVLDIMGFGPVFRSRLWNPYRNAKGLLIFNNLEFNEMSITSGTGQGDPLSGIAFMLSALPALIKLQLIPEIKPFIHKLEWVNSNDILYQNDFDECSTRKSETYSDDAFSTLVFDSFDTIIRYNKVFEDAQKFSNLKIVRSKTKFIFNHLPDQQVIDNLIMLGFDISNIIIPGQYVTLLGHLYFINDLLKTL